jgi:hypothetical protein
MATMAGPHGTIAECVEALQAEVDRITELLGLVKENAANSPSPSQHSADVMSGV